MKHLQFLSLALICAYSLVGCHSEEPPQLTPQTKTDEKETPKPEPTPPAPKVEESKGFEDAILYYFGGSYANNPGLDWGEDGALQAQFGAIDASGKVHTNIINEVNKLSLKVGYNAVMRRMGNKIYLFTPEPKPQADPATTVYKLYTLNATTLQIEREIGLKGYTDQYGESYAPKPIFAVIPDKSIYIYYHKRLRRFDAQTGELTQDDITQLGGYPYVGAAFVYEDKAFFTRREHDQIYCIDVKTNTVEATQLPEIVRKAIQISDEYLLIETDTTPEFILFSMKERKVIGSSFILAGGPKVAFNMALDTKTNRLYYSNTQPQGRGVLLMVDLSPVLQSKETLTLHSKEYCRFALEDASYALSGDLKPAIHPLQRKLYLSYQTALGKAHLTTFDLSDSSKDSDKPTSDIVLDGFPRVYGLFYNPKP